MHETHLIQPIIQGICKHMEAEGGSKVSQLRLKIGEFTGIKEDSFRETFQLLAKDTPLADAQLTINYFPAERIEVVSFDIE